MPVAHSLRVCCGSGYRLCLASRARRCDLQTLTPFVEERFLDQRMIENHTPGEPTLPSARRPPSPLDFCLSWMSPVFPQVTIFEVFENEQAAVESFKSVAA